MNGRTKSQALVLKNFGKKIIELHVQVPKIFLAKVILQNVKSQTLVPKMFGGSLPSNM